jgi:hypothetical protein
MAKKNFLGLLNFIERASTLIAKFRQKEEAVEHKIEKAHFKLKSNGDVVPDNAAAQNQVNKKIHIESGQDTPEWLRRRNIAAEQTKAADPNITEKELKKLLDRDETLRAPKETWSQGKTTLVTGATIFATGLGIGAGIPTIEGNLAASESFGYKPGDAPITLNFSHPVIDSIEQILPGENDAKSLATTRYANALSAASEKVFNRTDEDGNVRQVTVTPRERVKDAINRVAHAGLLDSLKEVPGQIAETDQKIADTAARKRELQSQEIARDTFDTISNRYARRGEHPSPSIE